METTRTYKDHSLTLTSNWRIEVVGPHFPDTQLARNRTFDALADAEQAIDKADADKIKEEAVHAANSLSLRVLGEDAEFYTITRINRTTSKLGGIPENVRKVYPAVNWIHGAIIKMRQLNAEVNNIRNSLAPLEMNVGRSYGRVEVDVLPRVIRSFIAEHKDKAAKAIEAAKPAPVVEEVKKSFPA